MPFVDSVDRLKQALDYHLERHNLLTANLAHVDTPGYRPLDLERRTEFRGVLHAAIVATDPRHIGASADKPWRVEVDPNCPPGEDGNAVSIDREAVKIATNNLRYEAIGTLVADQLSNLEWAANDGRGG
jgi:flagellar basal-body rod protein FlgB